MSQANNQQSANIQPQSSLVSLASDGIETGNLVEKVAEITSEIETTCRTSLICPAEISFLILTKFMYGFALGLSDLLREMVEGLYLVLTSDVIKPPVIVDHGKLTESFLLYIHCITNLRGYTNDTRGDKGFHDACYGLSVSIGSGIIGVPIGFKDALSEFFNTMCIGSSQKDVRKAAKRLFDISSVNLYTSYSVLYKLCGETETTRKSMVDLIKSKVKAEDIDMELLSKLNKKVGSKLFPLLFGSVDLSESVHNSESGSDSDNDIGAVDNRVLLDQTPRLPPLRSLGQARVLPPIAPVSINNNQASAPVAGLAELSIDDLSLSLEDFNIASKALALNPINFRSTIETLIVREATKVKLAFLITMVGPNPRNVLAKLETRAISAEEKKRVVVNCQVLEKELAKLSLRGTHYQQAMPDVFYAVRLGVLSKGGTLQSFCQTKYIPIEFQFPGAYPLIYNISKSWPQSLNPVVESYWKYFNVEFSRIISSSKSTVNESILSNQYKSAITLSEKLLKVQTISLEPIRIPELGYENVLMSILRLVSGFRLYVTEKYVKETSKAKIEELLPSSLQLESLSLYSHLLVIPDVI